jgi:UV DNA damage endonuclease
MFGVPLSRLLELRDLDASDEAAHQPAAPLSPRHSHTPDVSGMMFHVEQRRPRDDNQHRLGFAVKVVRRAGLRSHDTRRWQSRPHLRVSLAYLDRILDYLAEADIRMYRMASDLAPYITRMELPQQARQIEESEAELAATGARARALGLRLSLHPSQYVVLNTPDERVLATALRTFASHVAILDGLGLGPEHKIITHVGGLYGDRAGALARFATRYEALPEAVRARLIVENDDRLFDVADVLWLHERTGIPVVFDWLHHQALNLTALSAIDAATRALATWPAGQRPKLHFSSPACPLVPGRPVPHADDIDAADFLSFVTALPDIPYDIMLEAKRKDAALYRQRDDLAAAGLSGCFW